MELLHRLPQKMVDYKLRSFYDVTQTSASGGQDLFNLDAAWKGDLFSSLLVLHSVAFINVIHPKHPII